MQSRKRVVARTIPYVPSFGFVAASWLYDNIVDESAWKFSAQVNPIEGLTLKAWYQFDDGNTRFVERGFSTAAFGIGVLGGLTPAQFAALGINNSGQLGGDYNWGIGAAYRFGNAVDVYAGYSARDVRQPNFQAAAFGGFFAPGTRLVRDANIEDDFFVVGANVNLTSGLRFQPEVSFSDERTQLRLRLQRDF